jgi:hypothetical protein
VRPLIAHSAASAASRPCPRSSWTCGVRPDSSRLGYSSTDQRIMSLLIIGNCCDLNCTTMIPAKSFSQLDRVFPQRQARMQIIFPTSSPSQDGTSASDDPIMSGR